MPAQPREYERLPGSGFYSEGRIPVALLRSRLYLFGDHLLRVENSRFNERYRRFYLADIQSIVSVETKGWLGWIAFWSALLLCALPGIYFPLRSAEPNWALACGLGWPALIFLFYLLLSIWRGRSCRTEILTPGGREIIPSLNRVRTTRRTLAKILPAIQQAQAELAPALTQPWWGAREQQIRRAVAEQPAALSSAPPPLLLRRPSGWLLWPTPVCSLLAAAAFVLPTFAESGWFFVIGMMLGIFLVVPALVAIIRLPARLVGGLRGINVAAAIIGLVIGITFYVEIVAVSVKNSLRQRADRIEGIAAIVTHPPFSADAQLILTLIFAVLTGLVGAAAIISTVAWLQRNRRPAAPNL